MAKVVDHDFDDFKLDEDLNFDNFDMGALDTVISKEAKAKDRNPVITVVSDASRGVIKGATNKLTDPSFLGGIVKDALPDTYRETLNTVDEVSGTALSLYDNAVKEIRPQLSRFATKVDRLVPEESKLLKKLTSGFSNFVGPEETKYKSMSKEEIQNQSIASSLSSIFDAQQNTTLELAARDSIEDKIKDKIEQRRFTSNYGLLSSISSNINRLTIYNDKINQAYQKKSLEIQLRSYFVQTETLQTTSKYFEIFKAQNEVIVKNTALPEFVKIHNSERFQEIARSKLFGKIQNSIFGDESTIGKGIKNIANSAKQFISSFKDGLENAISGVEAMEQIKELNDSAAEFGGESITAAGMGGEAAAGWAADWLGGKVTGGLKKFLDSRPEVAENGYKLANMLKNTGGKAKGYRLSDEHEARLNKDGIKGKAASIFDWFLSNFQDTAPNLSIADVNSSAKLNEPSIFSEKTQKSITEIIPGYLSRILREVTSISTGDKNTDLVMFDYGTSKFINKKALSDKIIKRLQDKSKQTSVSHRVDNVAKELLGDTQVNDGDSNTIKNFLANISTLTNFDRTPENIKKTKYFKDLPEHIKKIISDSLDSKFAEGPKFEENKYKFDSGMDNLSSSMKDLRGDILDIVNSGNAEILEDNGLLKQTESGRYYADREQYFNLLKQPINKDIDTDNHFGSLSDVHAKRSIVKYSPKKTLEGINKTKLFNWRYKEGKGDNEPHMGPMAQDLNKNLGEEAAPGGTKIDLTTMNGANMAAIQALKDEQDKQLKGKDTEVILEKIRDNTSEIIEIIKGKSFNFGFGSLGGTGGSTQNTGKEYSDIAGNIFTNTAKLIGKSANDIFESAGKTFTFAKDKGIKPLIKGLDSLYENNKDSAGKAIKSIITGAGTLASTLFKTTSDLITDIVPKGLKKLKEVATKTKDFISKTLVKNVDIYIRGMSVPVIRANLLELGEYFDAKTGEVITSITEIKGEIKDKLGNIVITEEDIRKGLYDISGNKILTPFLKAGKFLIGAAISGAIKAKDTLLTLLKGVGPIGEKLVNGLSNLFSNINLGFGGEKTYNVLVEIRDILKYGPELAKAGDFMGPLRPGESTKDKLTSYADKAKGFFDKVTGKTGADDFVGPLRPGETTSQKLSGYADKAKGFFDKVTGKTGADDFVGPLRPGETTSQKLSGYADKAKGFFDKVTGKTGADDFVGPLRPGETTKDKLTDKAKDIIDKLTKYADKAKIKANEKLDDTGDDPDNPKQSLRNKMSKFKDKLKDNKIVKTIKETITKKKPDDAATPDLTPRYTSNTNVIDSIIGGGGKVISKGKSIVDNLKEAAPNIKQAKGLKGKAGVILGSIFNKDKQEEEPTEKSTNNKSKEIVKKSSPDSDNSAETTTTTTISNNTDKPAFNDRDNSGRRDGAAEDRLAKQEEDRKKRNEGKEVKADLALRYKSDQNIIDTIMEKASGVFSMITGGLSTLFASGGSVLGTIAGAAGGLFKLIPAAIKAPFKIAGKVIGAAGKIAKTVGAPLVRGVAAVSKIGGVAKAIKIAGIVRNAALIGGLMTGGLGTVVGGVIGVGMTALGTILTSPVLLGAAAIAAVAYGSYKAYKYFTKNKIDDFDKIRIMQYGLGYGKLDDSYNHYVLELEGYLESGKIGYDDGKAYFLDRKIDRKELLSIFSIDENDEEQISKFNEWFGNRFKPFFLTHLTALFSIDRKLKLSEIHKLKAAEKLKYLNLISFESGPYTVATSPFKEIDYLNVDKQVVLDKIKSVIDSLKVDAEKDKKKQETEKPKVVPEPKAPIVPKQAEPTVPDEKPKDKDDKKSVHVDTGEEGKNKESVSFMKKAEDAKSNNGMFANLMSSIKGGFEAEKEPSSPVSVGSVPVAPGPLSTGENASQFIKLQPNVKLDHVKPPLLDNFNSMVQEYGEETGKSLVVTSGSRTTAEQTRLYKQDPSKAAKPGRSLHEFGLALDGNSADFNKMDELGLMRKYGFTRPVGGEPWHIEPAGIQGNISLAKNDPTFAEQAIENSLFKGGGGAGATKGTPKGKRNPELAAKLLSANDDIVKPEDKDKGKVEEITKPKSESKAEQIVEAKKPEESESVKFLNNFRKDRKEVSLYKPEVVNSTVSASNDDVSKSYNTAEKYSKRDSLPDTEFKPDYSIATANDDRIIDTGDKGEVKQSIVKAANTVGTNPSFMTTFAAVESSLNPNAKANTSSASGLFQFTKGTWNEQISKHGRKYDLDPNTSPTDVTASSLMASEYVKSNTRILKSVKSDPNLTDIYLAHFLGATGARKFLSADPETIGAELLPRSAKSNKSIFYSGGRALTIGEIYNNLSAKLQNTAKNFGITLQTNSFTKSGNSTDKLSTPPNESKKLTTETVNNSVTKTEPTVKVKPDTEVNERQPPIKSKGIFTQPQNIINNTPNNVTSDLSSKTLINVDSTLNKSLDIQTKMLEVLKEILVNVGNNKPTGKGPAEVNKKDPPNFKGVPANGGIKNIPESAIDLKRKFI